MDRGGRGGGGGVGGGGAIADGHEGERLRAVVIGAAEWQRRRAASSPAHAAVLMV